MVQSIGEEFFDTYFPAVQSVTNARQESQQSSDYKVQIAAQTLVKPRMGKVSAEVEGGYNEDKGKHFEGKIKWEFDFGGTKEGNSSRESGSKNESINGSDVNSTDKR